jgi:hypothetical protein
LEDAADRSIMTTGIAKLNGCFASARSNPFKNCVSPASLGSLSRRVFTMCTQSVFSSLKHTEAMRELEEGLEHEEWEKAVTVSAVALYRS